MSDPPQYQEKKDTSPLRQVKKVLTQLLIFLFIAMPLMLYIITQINSNRWNGREPLICKYQLMFSIAQTSSTIRKDQGSV